MPDPHGWTQSESSFTDSRRALFDYTIDVRVGSGVDGGKK